MEYRYIYYFVLIILFLLQPLKGQENINPDGFNKFFYPNGSIQSEGYLKNGKPDGFWKNYYPTGVIKSEGKWNNSMLDSIWVFYSISGDTTSVIHYLMGKKNGYKYEYYYDSDRLSSGSHIKSMELYVNDLLEGISFYYDEEKNLIRKSTYSHNKLEGKTIEYDGNGRIITILNYRNGNITERQKINRYDENNLKTGDWIDFYTEDRIKSEVSYRNGLMHGYYKEYDQNGKLVLTLQYNNGILIKSIDEDDVGTIEKVYYSSDSSIVKTGNYKNDLPVGIHKEFNRKENRIISSIYTDSGVLISKGETNEDGIRIGIWEEYYPDGKIKSKGEYKNNLKEGRWDYFFMEGSIEQSGEFLRDKYSGLWTFYFSDGNVWKEEEYYNGLEEGEYIEYDKLGNIIVRGNYFDGEREGDWLTQINDMRAEGKYVYGLFDGRWKHFYDDGSLSFEGSYIQGSPDGKHKYFYPNGNIKEEQFYNSGIKQKNWKKYSENGELLITISYKDDKEFRINGIKVDFDDATVLID